MNRYRTLPIQKDLDKKMVWVSGPRQCGKTTLAQFFLKNETSGIYLNWDDPDHRKIILARKWSEDAGLIVLDEIHKYPKWKSWLKGTYDTTHDRHRFLVTGSARLDVYRRGGDSMLGRYHAWRLHPFCMSEHPKELSREEAFRRLMTVGGFPEIFLSGDLVEAKRWRRERRELVLREDVRDLEQVRDIALLSVLVDLLATRVGGPVAFSNLAEDLQVAPKTVKHWVEILERMFLFFRVLPYSKSLPRAISKAPKIFFYDNGDVELSDKNNDLGPRFENLVATHLLKRLHYLEDSTGDRFELNYLLDKEGHEVDFLIVQNRKPVCLIEAKWGDSSPSKNLTYFGQKLNIKNRIQLVGDLKKGGVYSNISVQPAAEWLSQPLDRVVF
ncbi:ATP-binding protein [Bdellovibrionota bacterium FG-1]